MSSGCAPRPGRLILLLGGLGTWALGLSLAVGESLPPPPEDESLLDGPSLLDEEPPERPPSREVLGPTPEPPPPSALLGRAPISPAVGDWVVFRVHEQARRVQVTLRCLASGATGLELELLVVGPGTWSERKLRIAPAAWRWERLPDLLVELIGRQPALPMQSFALRAVRGGVAPASPPGEQPCVSCARDVEPLLELEAIWRGADPALGGVELQRRALVLLRPEGELHGIVRATVEEWLVLAPAPSLRETIQLERLRGGNAADWAAERDRYRAR
ncbi:MAG: hypothetical protein RBU45_04655 [Myxococcota bacterium]|jgi:hypothetical protein|nr:hypothetical protein [Myxococcota bacterium]